MHALCVHISRWYLGAIVSNSDANWRSILHLRNKISQVMVVVLETAYHQEKSWQIQDIHKWAHSCLSTLLSLSRQVHNFWVSCMRQRSIILWFMVMQPFLPVCHNCCCSLMVCMTLGVAHLMFVRVMGVQDLCSPILAKHVWGSDFWEETYLSMKAQSVSIQTHSGLFWWMEAGW
jgi:hypothetical protein